MSQKRSFEHLEIVAVEIFVEGCVVHVMEDGRNYFGHFFADETFFVRQEKRSQRS